MSVASRSDLCVQSTSVGTVQSNGYELFDELVQSRMAIAQLQRCIGRVVG